MSRSPPLPVLSATEVAVLERFDAAYAAWRLANAGPRSLEAWERYCTMDEAHRERMRLVCTPGRGLFPFIRRFERTSDGHGWERWGFDAASLGCIFIQRDPAARRWRIARWRAPGVQGRPDEVGSSAEAPETPEDALQWLLPWPITPEALEAARVLLATQLPPARAPVPSQGHAARQLPLGFEP